MCLLGQPRTQPTPAGKTLVVSPKTRSTARHSWGTQRQETQGRRLSSPRLSQRLLTPLSVLSQEKESMTTSSCQHCSVLQFSPPPHKRFTGFLLRSVLRVGLSCVDIYIFFNLGKNWSLLRSRWGWSHAPWPIRLAEQAPSCNAGAVGRGCHPAPVDVYLSRTFRSMVNVHFTELIPRALLFFCAWFSP